MNYSTRREMQACLGLGLEDDQGNGVTINISNVAPTDTVDDDQAPITEASDETNGEEEKVEQLDDSAATLESLRETLTLAVSAGGMSPGEARLMQCAFDSAMRPLGGSSQKMLPSMESYGGSSDRLTTTQVSLETVKETLTKIWVAIKNAILKAFNFVVNFFAKLIGGVKKVKERAEALLKTANGLNGKTASGKIKTIAGSKLTLGGKLDEHSVTTGLSNLNVDNEYVFHQYVNSLGEYYGALAGLTSKLTGAGAVELREVDAGGLAAFKHAETHIVIPPSSTEVIGGCAFTAGTGSTSTEPATPVSFGRMKDVKSGDEHQELDPFSVDAIKKILASVIAVSTKLETKKDVLKAIEGKRNEAIAKLDENSKKADEGAVSRFVIRWAMKGASRAWLRPINSYAHFEFVVLRSALAITERSIAAYK